MSGWLATMKETGKGAEEREERDAGDGDAREGGGGEASLGFVLGSFLLGRGALLGIVAMAASWTNQRAPNDNKDFVAFAAHPLWDAFCRWDSGWYDRIARAGYFRADGQSDVAFFPAFPYLSRWLGHALGGHWPAGLALSNACLLAALFFVHEIARARLGADAARRAVWLVLLFPATVFFSAYYSESLFLCAAAGALFFYDRGRLLPAGLFGALAAATRGAGIVLLPALALGTLARAGWRPRAVPRTAAWLGLIPLGLVSFMTLLHFAVHDALAFVHVQASWGREAATPVGTLLRALAAFQPGEVMDWLDLAATLGLVAVTAVSFKKLDTAHAVFACGCVLLPLLSGTLRSMERYAATCVPIYVVLAMAARARWVERAVLLASGALMVVQTTLFVGWYWAG